MSLDDIDKRVRATMCPTTSFHDDGPRTRIEGRISAEDWDRVMALLAPPGWVADMLTRVTDAEHALRAPKVAAIKALRHGREAPSFAPLTADEMWALANKISVPSEFGVSYVPRYQAPHDVAETIAAAIEPKGHGSRLRRDVLTWAAQVARALYPKPVK